MAYIDGLVEDISNSCALAMVLLQSCINPSISTHDISLLILLGCFTTTEVTMNYMGKYGILVAT